MVFVAGTTPVLAADGTGNCVNSFRSSMLDLPQADISAEVNRMYDESLDVSMKDSTIYNSSQLFTWASETKVSCAKAIGFLASNEVNDEQISQCDCYYSRMRYYILR